MSLVYSALLFLIFWKKFQLSCLIISMAVNMLWGHPLLHCSVIQLLLVYVECVCVVCLFLYWHSFKLKLSYKICIFDSISNFTIVSYLSIYIFFLLQLVKFMHYFLSIFVSLTLIMSKLSTYQNFGKVCCVLGPA